jgi:transcriptional regulator with XRE-family HTH domain
MDKQDFAEWLRQEIDTRGWSYRELARRAKISVSTVSQVANQKQYPGADFCLSVARAFRVPPEQVFRRANILPGRVKHDPRVQEIIDTLQYLPSDDLDRVLAVVQGFYRLKEGA